MSSAFMANARLEQQLLYMNDQLHQPAVHVIIQVNPELQQKEGKPFSHPLTNKSLYWL
jgi:hypothetical protein